jgi:hypothetical protein
LIDLQHFQQITKTVFKQDGQDLSVAVEVSIGPADDTDFSDAEHELSRKSCPNGLGIDFPTEGLFWPSDSQWNNGMLEKWNIGYKKRSAAGGLISNPCRLIKIRFHSARPGIPWPRPITYKACSNNVFNNCNIGNNSCESGARAGHHSIIPTFQQHGTNSETLAL